MLAHQALARFQLDVMPLSIRPRPPCVRRTRAVRKATSQIRHLVHQLVVSIGAIELLYQLKVRRLARVMLFESEGFETSKVCDHNQSILHNLLSALNLTGQPRGMTRPDR